MIITGIETWFCRRDRSSVDDTCLMPWDVVVLRILTDEGFSSVVSFLGARSGLVTESSLHENILPMLLGRDVHHREAIWHEFWNLDRRLAFFPAYLPGPVDVALWELAALQANLPLYRYIGACRTSLPVYAGGLLHTSAEEYVAEAKKYASDGIKAYKARVCGPWNADMEVAAALREGLGKEASLLSAPAEEYSLEEAVRVGRHLESLNFLRLEEPFHDFELTKYRKLCDTLDLPVAATEIARGPHWGVAQEIVHGGVDIVRVDMSWKNGVTGTLKIARFVEDFGLECELHATSMGLMDLANLHVSCAMPNCRYFERLLPEESFSFPLKKPLDISPDGETHVLEVPGIGGEVDWEWVDRMCVSHRASSL